MNSRKWLGWLVVLLVIIGGIFLVWHRKLTSSQPASGKIQVTASFYPLYFFASQIGGDKAQVTNITPTGAEPHDYEPTAQDIATIENSKLVILEGSGLEAWENDVQQTLDPHKTVVVEAGQGLATRQITEDGQNILDPHVWLDPPLAKQMAEVILQGFIKADPSHQNYYATNAEKLKAQLDQLDGQYRQGLAHCQQHSIVTSHAAFGYLTSTYGLIQVSIAGLSPDAQPSSKQLADLANFVKNHHIQYIFFESLASPKLSETLATETGVKTLVLNPLEGLTSQEIAQGQTYLTQMQQNLENLKIALQCQ